MDHLKIIPTQATLVDFDEPEFVRDVEEASEKVEAPPVLEVSVDNEIKYMMSLRLSPNCPDPDTYDHLELDEILNELIPPVEWIEEGKMWRQNVSSQEASRSDLLTLAKDLDSMLHSRKAADHGICPIRRQLYSQFFDELIRQVTVLSPETGLLLMRVRDELHLTLDATASIYESCKAFESRCINAPPKTAVTVDANEDRGNDLALKLAEIEAEKEMLKLQIRNLEDALQLREVKFKEMIDAGESLFQEELEHLKQVKIQLQDQLKLFKGPNPHAETVAESILDKFLNQAPKT